MEKQEVGPGIPTLKEELGDERVAEWVERCKCDYVVYSAAQGELDRIHGRRYDESKEDFVFDAELEDEGGEQETAATQSVEDVQQKDGQPKDLEKDAGEQETSVGRVVEIVEQKGQPKESEEEVVEQETVVRQVVEDAEQKDGQPMD